MKLCELVKEIEYACPHTLPDAEITYICHDSRKAGPDSLFICIVGYVSD